MKSMKATKLIKAMKTAKLILKKPAGAKKLKEMAQAQGCASTGKLLSTKPKRRPGRNFCKEAPGPKYSGQNVGETTSLSKKSKFVRISYRALASLGPSDRVRIAGALGYLKSKEGEKCPGGCKRQLQLFDGKSRSEKKHTKFGGVSLEYDTLCRYYCHGDNKKVKGRQCEGERHGYAVEDDGKKTGIQLGGRGRAPAGEGLLAACLACQPWAAHHVSRGDCTLLHGVSKDSMQLYLDEVRRAQAALGQAEQANIVFKKGMLIEWDECGVRAVRVKCKHPCRECAHCEGYRLLWNRWIIGVERGNRRMLVVKQLPWRTSEAGAGGVPLNGADCDLCCLPNLSKGVINLTDGASAYEAFASGLIACSPDCENKACLARARARGEDKCSGWRPRTGRARFESKYKALNLSHGVVSHKQEEWSVVKSVVVHNANGSSRTIMLKHGTEVADGAWAEVKASFPSGINSSDHKRLAEYVYSWAWRARRHGEDLFTTMGPLLRN